MQTRPTPWQHRRFLEPSETHMPGFDHELESTHGRGHFPHTSPSPFQVMMSNTVRPDECFWDGKNNHDASLQNGTELLARLTPARKRLHTTWPTRRGTALWTREELGAVLWQRSSFQAAWVKPLSSRRHPSHWSHMVWQQACHACGEGLNGPGPRRCTVSIPDVEM